MGATIMYITGEKTQFLFYFCKELRKSVIISRPLRISMLRCKTSNRVHIHFPYFLRCVSNSFHRNLATKFSEIYTCITPSILCFVMDHFTSYVQYHAPYLAAYYAVDEEMVSISIHFFNSTSTTHVCAPSM